MKNRKSFSRLYKILSILVAVITLTSVLAFAYNIAVPSVTTPVITEKFTDFYVINASGKPFDSPQNLAVGEPLKAIAGIVNQEQEAVIYRIEVTINQVKTNDVGPLVLAQGETRQEPLTFQPVAGDNQTIAFLLYRTGQDGVYKSASILVNVK